MASFSNIYRLSNCVISGYKTALHGRASLHTTAICSTRKSAEERLGIAKPKRPLTPFFKFMSQMRPTLIARNPGMSAKESIQWSGKHWQELDAEAKTQLTKEYEKDMQDYRKIKQMYEATLTDEQKIDIKKVKEEISAGREKKKLKAEYKELGRPKKPPSSYLLFMMAKKDLLQGKSAAKNQGIIRDEWMKLPTQEKSKFEKQAEEMLKKYKKDLEAWELKMITMDRIDLVKTKQSRVRLTDKSTDKTATPKPKEAKKQ